MGLALEPLLDYHVNLHIPKLVGTGPYGTRWVFDVKDGKFTFQHNGMQGSIQPSGGDWMLMDSDRVRRLDVRSLFLTDDGAEIYVQYYGILKLPAAVEDELEAGGMIDAMDFGEAYFVTQPRFETGHPNYTWLNSVAAVGEGRLLPLAADYRIFKVDHA